MFAGPKITVTDNRIATSPTKVMFFFFFIQGWPQPRLTWYQENTVLDSTYQLSNGCDRDRHTHQHGPPAGARVTVNRLSLTNVTRWHPIMSQRQQATGTARLTCQASNSIAAATAAGVPGSPPNAGHPPPPATTEHVFIRLNRECFVRFDAMMAVFERFWNLLLHTHTQARVRTGDRWKLF